MEKRKQITELKEKELKELIEKTISIKSKDNPDGKSFDIYIDGIDELVKSLLFGVVKRF